MLPKNLFQRTVLDATKINCFLECPRKFFFSHVLNWKPEAPNNHLIFGAAWHEAMEVLLLEGYSENALSHAIDAFMASYREHFGPETDTFFGNKTPQNAERALREYVDHYQNDRFSVLLTEIGGTVSITETYSLAFRMDSICQNEKGELFSLEHKTKGGAFNRQWRDQWPLAFQVGVYSHVLYSYAVDRPVKGVIINGVGFDKKTNHFERIWISKTKDHLLNWLFHARTYIQTIENEFNLLSECTENDPVLSAFPQNPQSCTKYFGCEFLDLCLAWANPLQRYDPETPPIGFHFSEWNPLDQPTRTTLTF